MKEIVIFGSYCNTKEKLVTLEKSITDAKNLGLDVMVFGRYPIPESTQKMCDYWIYDKSNPILEDRNLEHWLLHSGKRISNWFQDYGYAALEQITKTLGFANNLEYDVAYWLVYDVDLTHFSDFRSLCLDKLTIHDAVCHAFHPVSYGPAKGISGTSVGFKVRESYNRLKGTITKTFYRDLISRRTAFISEDFMEECFKISELNYYLMPEPPNLPATLTSTGVRKHGDVPPEFIGCRKYFLNCFIGHDTDKDCQIIFIYNILQHVNSITLQVNNNVVYDENVRINEFGGIEILVSDSKFLRILKINEESINETLDSELTELYWHLNKIKNLDS